MNEESILEISFQRQPAIVTRRVAEEVILVPVTGRMAQEGSLYTLNGTSAFLWEQLDGRRTGRDLVRELKETYEVEEKLAESDVQTFLTQLQEIGAIAST